MKTMHINKLFLCLAIAALLTQAMAQNAPIFPKAELATTKTTWEMFG